MYFQQLRSDFDRSAKWLQDALEYNGGHQTIDDVWKGLVSGAYSLVAGKNCAIVLEPSNTAQKKVMNFFLAGGDLEELQELERKISAKCKADGFDLMLIVGRRGWVKRLKGYKQTAVILEKAL